MPTGPRLIVVLFFVLIIAAVIIYTSIHNKTHAPAEKTISNGWNLTIMILSILGAITGFVIPGWSIKALILAVTLVLIALIKKRKILFTLYGIASIVWVFWMVFRFRDGFRLLSIVELVVGTMAVMGMMIVGVWSEKALLVWLALPVLLASVFVLHAGDLRDCIIVIIAALYVHGLKASQKAAANSTPESMQPVFSEPAISPSDSSATPAAPLFDHDSIIVDQKVRMLKFGDAYALYDVDGNIIGNVAQENISGGAKAAQVMFGKKMKSIQSFEFVISDASGKRVGGISRKGSLYTSIEDASGNLIGRMKFGKLIADDGRILAIAKTSGLSKIRILDENGTEMATINYKWNGVVKTLIASADKYLILFANDLDPIKKSNVLAMCIAFDFISSN